MLCEDEVLELLVDERPSREVSLPSEGLTTREGNAVLTQTLQPTREEERRGQTRVFDDKMCNRIWAVKLSSGTMTELCMHTAWPRAGRLGILTEREICRPLTHAHADASTARQTDLQRMPPSS